MDQTFVSGLGNIYVNEALFVSKILPFRPCSSLTDNEFRKLILNIRKILNLGHTFAHAYEASLGYSKKLNHGEAVILGIISVTKFSLQNNFLSKNDYEKILSHIHELKLNYNSIAAASEGTERINFTTQQGSIHIPINRLTKMLEN